MKIASKSLPIRVEFLVLLALVLWISAAVYGFQALNKLAQQHRAADVQWMQMQSMAAQATNLKAQVQAHGAHANTALLLQEVVAEHWGSTASVQMQADQAIVSLNKTPAANFAEGLEQVRRATTASYTGARISVIGGFVTGSVDLRLQAGP